MTCVTMGGHNSMPFWMRYISTEGPYCTYIYPPQNLHTYTRAGMHQRIYIHKNMSNHFFDSCNNFTRGTSLYDLFVIEF